VARLAPAIHADDLTLAQSVAEQLRARGGEAVESVVASYADADGITRAALVWVLGGIRSYRGYDALLGVLSDPEEPDSLRSAALEGLSGRQIARELTEAEFGALTDLVAGAQVKQAGQAALVLGRCKGNPSRPRVAAIAARLRDETRAGPSASELPTTRIAELKPFVDAFGHIGVGGQAAVRDELAATQGPARTWLVLAAGMVCYRAVGAELEAMLRSEPNIYMRYLAVGAFARSMGREAVALLTELANDPTMARPAGVALGLPYLERPIIKEAAGWELHRRKYAAQ